MKVLSAVEKNCYIERKREKERRGKEKDKKKKRQARRKEGERVRHSYFWNNQPSICLKIRKRFCQFHKEYKYLTPIEILKNQTNKPTKTLGIWDLKKHFVKFSQANGRHNSTDTLNSSSHPAFLSDSLTKILIKMLVYCWWECKLLQPLQKTVWKSLKQLKINLSYDPAIPLLGT